MSVGLVFVSHSGRLADGIVELARQMAPSVALVGAGGTDGGGIGTSFEKVTAALAEADTGDGVVIVCDLGSAVLTTETALDFLDDDARSRVRLADGPFVEGGVAAAVAAESGAGLDEVLAAAEGAPDAASAPGGTAAPAAESGAVTGSAVLVNRDGLHARPAADFVKRASGYDARITVNGTDAKSLLGIMALGLVKGREVEIRAEGAEAQKAVTELIALIESGFGEA